jgi:hypothetical protein
MSIAAQRLGGVTLAALAFALPLPSGAQPKAIATVETNMKATAELYECKRKEGVLTLKVRFKAPAASTTIDLPYKDTYVVDVASGKKYFVLRDSDKVAVATPTEGWTDRVRHSLEAGGTFNAWWKFPAPPPTTKKVSFFLPKSEPFEDLPITDAP